MNRTGVADCIIVSAQVPADVHGELAERAGHSKPSMSLDIYTHVMPVDEVASERFLDLLTRQAEDVTRP
jgi:hypothetical protein